MVTRHMNQGVELTWPNKGLSLRASGVNSYKWVDPSDATLRHPLTAETFGTAPIGPHSNVLAIGDGLDAMEALSEANVFADGVRAVYIDPPFNTGKSFNQYGDALARPIWLSMMRDRLEALKSHLREDASVWVHLDDSEVHRARMIMDEVFGEDAFVASVIWQKRTTRDSRAAFSSNHDTILVYAPSGPRKWKLSRNLLAKDEAMLRNRDDDPRGPWADAPFTAPGFRKAQQYEIVTPSGSVVRPPRGRSWYATEPTYRQLLEEGRIWFPKGGAGSPRIKLFAHQLRGLVPFTVWGSSDVGTNDDAKRHLLELFPERPVFDTPKPEELLERILHIATNPGELVVDLFAGSGTTAATAHKMRRRWVTVERNTQTILDFTLPRLQQVVEGTDRGGITNQVSWVGGGSFEVVQVVPRFGALTGVHRPKALQSKLATALSRPIATFASPA